ncbi:esterase FE4-like [Nymphalis io]|uniref:esterase FE4-like n=1 Tax=Inachis io TaxID=171585 RepID=UPI002169F936|nr:esterase FE4-like [Nymphalis io]XP_050360156.1 esterase FE4-like [Nymphalis io]XP_050360157.1 esterase FE4-like [Nymphalis io]
MSHRPEVHTKVGVIRGLKSDDGSYNMFLGIPYGMVEKNNPFGLSKPYPPFDSPFEANNDTAASPQIEEFNKTIIGTLDCLHANIYVPKCANKLPVLIHLHGGRFEIGFSGRYFYGPSYFMKQSIILVTFNYRLGPYGFMCLDTPEIPGNQGLRDALSAIRWIKDNIQSFGGDADNITICGHSAGAIILGILLTLDQDLFHKAIQMSGTILRPGVIQQSDTEYPIKLAADLGFITDDAKKAIDFLANLDPKQVIKAHVETGVPIYPYIEKKFDNIEQIISDKATNLIKNKLKNIPILIGNTTSESILVYYHKTSDEFEHIDPFNDHLKKVFNFEGNNQKISERIVRQFYIGDEKISANVRWGLVDFYSDFNFVYPIQDTIKEYLDQSLEVYHYEFSYNGSRNFVKKRFNVVGGGASHADELTYLYDVSFEGDVTKDDQLMIDRLTTMWANFAKYGNPTPVVSELLPTKWLPATKDALYYLDIGADLKLGKKPNHKRMAFWELFYRSNKEFLK